MRRGILYLFILMVMAPGVCFAQAARSWDFTQNFSLKTVPLAMGGAYRSVAHSTPAILLNPAGMALNKGTVAIGGDYVHSGMTSSNAFSLGVVDFKATEAIALGFSYDRDQFDVGGNVEANQFTLAAATEFGSFIFLGASLKGYLSTVDSPLAGGPDGADMDFGLLVRPIPYLQFAFTTHNVIQGKNRPAFPLQIAYGGALILEDMGKVAIDFVHDFATPSPNNFNGYFGGEARITEGVFLRGGFGLDRVRDNNFYSIGAAVSGPKIGMNFTFSQRLSPTEETYAASVEMFL